jgi:endonuclease YncB( thermonuclease family)
MMILAAALSIMTVASVPVDQAFQCTPTHVWDGDGPIWCAEGPKVRLAGIAAREMDGTCKPGHPCPGATATAARDGLARLLGKVTGTAPTGHLLVKGPPLRCRSEGGAGGKRTAAWCISPVHGDISCEMVKAGLAVRWARYWRAHRCG